MQKNGEVIPPLKLSDSVELQKLVRIHWELSLRLSLLGWLHHQLCLDRNIRPSVVFK